MKKNISFILIFFTALITQAECQPSEIFQTKPSYLIFCNNQIVQSDSNKNQKSRNLFLFSSIGVFEILSFGVGYQINESFSFSIKGAAAVIGSPGWLLPSGGRGLGLKASYNKSLWIFNVASLEYVAYLSTTQDLQIKGYEPLFKGSYFDINMGREIIDEPGFNFFWAIGLGISAAKEAKTLKGLSLKIGYNFNF